MSAQQQPQTKPRALAAIGPTMHLWPPLGLPLRDIERIFGETERAAEARGQKMLLIGMPDKILDTERFQKAEYKRRIKGKSRRWAEFGLMDESVETDDD